MLSRPTPCACACIARWSQLPVRLVWRCHVLRLCLLQALWGDWCFLPKERRVVRGSKARAASGSGRSAPRSMFEQFALEPIWRAYSVCEGEDVQVCLLAGGQWQGGDGWASKPSDRWTGHSTCSWVRWYGGLQGQVAAGLLSHAMLTDTCAHVQCKLHTCQAY